jgi:hypothetical protein
VGHVGFFGKKPHGLNWHGILHLPNAIVNLDQRAFYLGIPALAIGLCKFVCRGAKTVLGKGSYLFGGAGSLNLNRHWLQTPHSVRKLI